MGAFLDRVAEEICIRQNGAGAWSSAPPEVKQAWKTDAYAHIYAYMDSDNRKQLSVPVQRRLSEIAVELGYADADTACLVELGSPMP